MEELFYKQNFSYLVGGQALLMIRFPIAEMPLFNICFTGQCFFLKGLLNRTDFGIELLPLPQLSKSNVLENSREAGKLHKERRKSSSNV
jgi:hypothetical protein